MNRTNTIILPVVLVSMGAFICAPSLFPLVLEGYGTPLNTVGLIVAGFSLGGLLSVATFPTWCFKRRIAKSTRGLCLITGALFMIGMFNIPIESLTTWLAAIASFLAGATLFPIQKFFLSYALLQPDIKDANAGTLTGIIVAALGFAFTILAGIVGAMVNTLGLLPGAQLFSGVLVIVRILSAILIDQPNVEPAKMYTFRNYSIITDDAECSPRLGGYPKPAERVTILPIEKEQIYHGRIDPGKANRRQHTDSRWLNRSKLDGGRFTVRHSTRTLERRKPSSHYHAASRLC